MPKPARLIGVNAAGLPVGEDAPGAKLSNHDVDLIRELHEEHRLSYGVLAEKFEVSKGLIRDICKYKKRVATPVRYVKQSDA